MWKQNDPCEAASIGGTFVENGVTFVKLKDNKCWTKSSQGATVWSGAAALCPDDTYLPSAQDFVDLLTAYGGTKNTNYGEPYGWSDADADLYNATGWSGYYWPSTEISTKAAWYLRVWSTGGVSYAYYANKSNSYNVVCIRSSS